MRLLITQTPTTPLTLDAQNRRVFPAQISFEGYNTYPITVTDPFTPAQEAELEWYYERWLNFPFTDKIRAQHAAASIRTYGYDLFNQLFRTDPNLYADYREQRHGPFTIEIIGEPEFHTLHWESLHDPDQDRPLTVDKAIIRRNHKAIHTPASVKPSPTLNILLVTARPGGKLDVGYRTISRPLVDALENSQLPTRIDIVRPGTFKALLQHLENSRDQHGDGYYQVIHLDMHGSLLTYAQYQQRETEWTLQRELFKTGYGQEPITEYDGVKAFLAFAGETGGTDLVAADDLARVLNARQVPIAILNACQSGKQVGAEETSLGSRLLTTGVQLVVAMGYSVTVSAAKLLMTHLYQHLLKGDSLETAIRRARLELYHVKTRRAAFSQQIDLEDWLLPVVYQHRPVRLNSKAFDWTALAQEADSAHKPPHTNYGFVGRDVDILEVERHLLKDEQSNLLLMRGMGGAGKTTLLHHLAWWWQKTRLVQKVFYFGYDVKAYYPQEIIATLALALLGKVDVPWLAVRQKLRAERHLLILDNLESITGERLAVQNTLPPAEQTTLRAFLADLIGGRTLILLGSRSDEQWLVGSGQPVSMSAGQQEASQQPASQQSAVSSGQSASQSLSPSVSQSPLAASPPLPLAASLTHLPTYDLPGLDPEAQSELAEAILQRLGKSHYRSAEPHREPFRQLLKLLGGYPLALEVVLNNLHHQTPAQVLEALTQADVALDKDADTGDKTKSILECIDYSHGNLSPLAQDVLLCLAPFTGVVNTSLLSQYIAQLQKAWEEVSTVQPSEGLSNQTTSSPKPSEGSFSPLSVEQPSEGLSHPSTPPQKPSEGSFAQEKPGFLTADAVQWQAVLQEAARWGLVASHEVGGGYLRLQPVLPYFLKTRLHDPAQAARQQVIETAFREHYQQVGQALHQLITSKQPQERQTGQTLIGLEYENLLTAVNLALTARSNFYHAYEAVYQILLAQKLYEQIEKVSQFILSYRPNYSKEQLTHQPGELFAHVQSRLARSYFETQQYDKSRQNYELNLVFWDGLDHLPEKAKALNRAVGLHQLGWVAHAQRQWNAAADYYWQALQIKIKFNDRCEQAKEYHHLGMVAQAQRQWDAAADYYWQALQIFIEFNDRYPQATVLHQLGMVAQEQKQWDAAADYFRQALQIDIEFNDRYEQAKEYHHLGMVAQEQRQDDAAADYFRHALQIFIEFNDRYPQATVLHMLGIVAQAQRQWDAAADYYRQALQIKIEFNDRYSQASTLHMLGMVAQEQRQWDAAADYFRQALQLKIEFNDHYGQASTLGQMGFMAEEQEKWSAAADYLFQALGIFAQSSDQHSTGFAIWGLARVWQASGQGADIPARLATLFGVTPAQAEELLREVG